MSVLHTAHLRVRDDTIAPFKARLLRHAGTSLDEEPGCVRFDVFQETGDPALFLLIEEYADRAALEAHRASPHFKAFRHDTSEWVIERTWWFWQPVSE